MGAGHRRAGTRLEGHAVHRAGVRRLVGFAGTGDPEVETDFTRLGYTDVTAGWRPYHWGWTFRTDATGRFRVRWKTSR
jgi:hypothetical protein